MYCVVGGPGRILGSAALRYRRPPAERPWPPAPGCGGLRRHRWLGDADDERGGAEGPTARRPAIARLEAVLFVAREPLGSRKLADLASLADGTEARTLVRQLNRLYDAEGCAFHAVEVAGGFQLMSRPKFAPWLRRLHASPVDVRLSAPAMETLAVVAYRQPVLRAQIEAIRGVQCGEILRQLMERDLVRIVARSEELGRPFLYGTTRRFLEVFGLRHLDELPRAELGQTPQRVRPEGELADSIERAPDGEFSSQPIHSGTTQGDLNVKRADDTVLLPEDLVDEDAATKSEQQPTHISDEEDFDDEDFDDEDEDLDDDEDDDEDFEDEDEDLDDEEDDDEDDEDLEDDDDDLEEDEWEEVEDDEDLDEDDWDEEEDDDWDEDDEEEEDEDDEDWD